MSAESAESKRDGASPTFQQMERIPGLSGTPARGSQWREARGWPEQRAQAEGPKAV